MAEMRFIETIAQLEDICEDMQCTLQITFRVRVTPRWCVRIQRKGSHSLIYRQAVDDDLSEAIESCVDAWIIDEEAPKAGRKPGTDLDRD